MGVNTEMHDCEPAMTRPQHFNMSYGPPFFSPSSIHGQITQTLCAAGIKHHLLLPLHPGFLISAQWMTPALLTMRGLIF